MLLTAGSLEQVLLVGLAYQREVRPDNQDHMPARGLSHRLISDTCVLSHGAEVCVLCVYAVCTL